jgi:hypothetical protein
MARRAGAWLMSLATLGASLGVAPLAFGHAGPARAVGVEVSPEDPDHVLVRTTYGMLLTRDGGQSFGWLCGAGAGFDADIELPEVGWFPNGRLVIGTFDGLRASDDGCDWQPPGGAVGSSYFTNVTVGSSPSEILLLSTSGIGGYRYEVALWSSDDGGASWHSRGRAPDPSFLPFNVRSAPARPDTIAMAGRDGDARALGEVMMRSTDGGDSWQRTALSDVADAVTHVVGFDPAASGRVYLSSVVTGNRPSVTIRRVDATNDRATANPSPTVEVLAALEGIVSSVVLAPDGTHLLIGTEDRGLWRLDSETLALEQTVELSVQCLRYDGARLYACVDEDVEGYTVGVSTDAGVTFEPFMWRSSPCGPLACGATTTVGAMCPAAWTSEQEELGAGCDSVGDVADAGADSAPSASCAHGHGPGEPEAPWRWLVLGAVVWRRQRRGGG